MKRFLIQWCITILLLLPGFTLAQEIDWEHFDPKRATPRELERVARFLENNLRKSVPNGTTGSPSEIKSLTINGNKITTVVYNYGNITRPNTLGGTADLVWNRLGYGFEFSPLVAGKVRGTSNGRDTTFKILDDGMWLPGQGGYAPDGSLKWGWLPKPGYSAPGQNRIASWSNRDAVNGDLTRRPPTWPESWFNSILGRYVWPAFLGNDATSPDEEVYFVTDDYTNRKYPYYPFPDDSTKRGMGLDLECRFFQFNNALAEDIIFLVYRVTNRSPKVIDSVWFGMYGDPHVGGAADFNDDRAYFIPPDGPLAEPYPQRSRSMVYAWDPDGRGGGGLPTGYFGFKFLESPTNSGNGHDDDDDGITDESPFNDAGFFIDGVTTPVTFGIRDTTKYKRLYGSPKPRWSGDENGNWDPRTDDVGIDGLASTNDFGEGNGRPDVGRDAENNLTAEPNFGLRDVNESDQIGLTSFWVLPYTNSLPNVPKNDQYFFGLLSSDSIDINQELLNTPADNIFVYGSGPFRLGPGETQRFSVALLMGNDLQDLVANADISQQVLEANYRFAAPPPRPNVTAIPGEKRVTLYWDDIAERSEDPLSRKNDFEGYKIYRSEDPSFADVFTITDANGNPHLGKPMAQNGVPAQFDLVNEFSGFHPVLTKGVQYNLGSNTGLVHQYVDSSITNGKTYYYAVVSYDHGSGLLDTAKFSPAEVTADIAKDPITNVLSFKSNQVQVVPGPLPLGTSVATAGTNGLARRVRGISTGPVAIKILDDRSVPDNATYTVDFFRKDTLLVYNVTSQTPVTEKFISRDTVQVPLSKRNIITDGVEVRDASGAVVPATSYAIDPTRGFVKGRTTGSLRKDAEFTITYRYYTTFESPRIANEDGNPVFDGMKLFVNNAPLGIDSANSKWAAPNNSNLTAKVFRPTALPTAPFRPAPLDFEIRWNRTDRDARGKWMFPGDTLLNNNGRKVVVCPFRIINVTDTTSVRILVTGALADSIWKPGREIFFITPPRFALQSPIPGMLGVNYFAPADTSIPIVYPPEGSIHEVKTTKPFAIGDQYTFTSQAVKFDAKKTTSLLDKINVVPNPYVAYSDLEGPAALSSKRGDNRLQFRNLPPKCTIRIYTMVGELVDTIIKDDDTSIASWNVLSYEGQRLSYGVYIYNVDVPGVGEKIGRLALIK